MGFSYLANQIEVDVVLNANVTSTGTSSTAFDTVTYEGPVLVNVDARASGTNSMAISIEESESGTGSWTAVPADALINPDTGDADTFDAVTTSASSQTLAVIQSLCQRYLRVTLSGTGLDQNVVATFIAQQKYTEP